MKENIAPVKSTSGKLKYLTGLEEACPFYDRLFKISVLQVNPSNYIEDYLSG